MLTNNDIINLYYNLVSDCVMFQCRKYGWLKEKDDILQDILLILLEYDNSKLNTIHNDNRMNCFVTGILVRQLHSVNSPAYKKYRKDNDRQVSINDFFDK